MRVRRQPTETKGEREARSRGNFDQVESELSQHLSTSAVPFASVLRFIIGLLSKAPPGNQRADPEQHTVWLFDGTAYQSPSRQSLFRDGRHHERPAWHVEVVACIFERQSREDVGKIVALIADLVGVDGRMGMDDRLVRQRIAERVQPFVNAVVPARFVTLDVPVSRRTVQKHRLRPSNRHGIISQTIRITDSEHKISDGTLIRPSLRQWPRAVAMYTTFASPDGWAIISDVDDTIKYTMTADAIGILRSTFVDEPAPVAGMPQLYHHINKQLNPTWFYLSASPYNLYPFLRAFIRTFYPHGTLLLRQNSWMDLPGLLKSFTQGTRAYKVDRMEHLHNWFPKRKILCIGDSTQNDPEAYGEMYRKHRKWIRAILIRKVTDVANMEEKNTEERFRAAFRGVPSRVWKVFVHPDELYSLVDQLR
ncbi:hypothetical protein VTO42DRAFT_3162 [Malbranchea cinnamomea]